MPLPKDQQKKFDALVRLAAQPTSEAPATQQRSDGYKRKRTGLHMYVTVTVKRRGTSRRSNA